MKNILIIVVFIFIVFTEGWAEQNVKINGPFATYSRETFVKNDTGETGLNIVGEDWYVLINLNGFKDIDINFTSPGEFLFKMKDGIILSCFAEETKNVSDEQACINKIVPKEYQKEINGRKVAIRDHSSGRKSLNYCPYYKGYCFDFHFSFLAKDEKKVFDIIDSIKFVNGKFSNARIKKYFYTNDKRIELTIPSDWKVDYEDFYEKFGKKMPSIKFLPDKGNNFVMLISLYGGIWGKPVAVDKVKQNALELTEKHATHAVYKPVFQELKNEKVNMFYYSDLQDKNHNPKDPEDFPYQSQGHAEIEGSGLYFSIYYREKGCADVKNGIEVIKNSKILDLKK